MSAAVDVAWLSAWIDTHAPNASCTSEELIHRRVSKVYAEVGEVADAMSGWTGENPRKGVTHTRGDVIAELLDVALAAVCAVEHLTGNMAEAWEMLDRHAARVRQRADSAAPTVEGPS